MKQEKGITTTSVIIYLIVMIIVLATLTVISGYFFEVVRTNIRNNEYNKQYSIFLSYFVEDIQQRDNEIIEAKTEAEINYIKFSNGNTYKFDVANKRLYKNNIKISDDVEYCRFDYEVAGENKHKITVDFVAGKFKKIDQNALIFYMT